MVWRSGSTTVSHTKRITELGRNGDVGKAFELFERIPLKNQVSWNAMLSVLLDCGHLESALRLFDEMPVKNPTSYTATIAALSRSGLVSRARRIFDSIPTFDHNVFSWTSMISCHAQNREPRQALKLFSDLYRHFFERKIVPNSHTFSILVKSCGAIQSLVAARQIHSLFIKLLGEDGQNSIFVLNSLIHINVKSGELVDAERIFGRMRWRDMGSYNTIMDGYTHHLMMDKAFRVFDSMREKDALSWNIIISGLVESRLGEQALRLFIRFLRSGEDHVKPNPSTYTIVLTACSILTALGFGTQIHARIIRNGLYHSNTFVSNSLITMYTSCGLKEELEQVFDEMPKRDVVSWNSVIQGLGQNGCTQRALEVAERALGAKNFNHNTFTAILTSCSHGGLLVQGLNYFNSMRGKYCIEPSLDHYICVVDMLGRAGNLEAAHRLVRDMPLTTPAAWGALINACLIHGNSDIGIIAAQEMQILQPGEVRSYLALANIYPMTERMEQMRPKDFRKEPGCSWVVSS